MEGADPLGLIEARGLRQVTDTSAIEAVIQRVLEANPSVVENVKSGNIKAVNALFGPIMKEMGGKAKPDLVRELLNKALGIG